MIITELVVDHGRYSGGSTADGDGAILKKDLSIERCSSPVVQEDE